MRPEDADCRQCVYRRDAGADWSSCHHPEARTPSVLVKAVHMAFDALRPHGPVLVGIESPGLSLAFDAIDVRSGRVMWPHAYDPAPLHDCDGFKPLDATYQTRKDHQ